MYICIMYICISESVIWEVFNGTVSNASEANINCLSINPRTQTRAASPGILALDESGFSPSNYFTPLWLILGILGLILLLLLCFLLCRCMTG